METILTHYQAIDYATGRACFRSGEIGVLASNDAVARIIPFTETTAGIADEDHRLFGLITEDQ